MPKIYKWLWKIIFNAKLFAITRAFKLLSVATCAKRHELQPPHNEIFYFFIFCYFCMLNTVILKINVLPANGGLKSNVAFVALTEVTTP